MVIILYLTEISAFILPVQLTIIGFEMVFIIILIIVLDGSCALKTVILVLIALIRVKENIQNEKLKSRVNTFDIFPCKLYTFSIFTKITASFSDN